jgi:hypothetical protein
MEPSRRDSRPSPALFGAAGWLFADLLLALAMIFLVTNTAGHLSAAAPTPLPAHATPTPKPTALPALDLTPIVLTVSVDYAQLHAGDPAALAAVEGQLRGDRRLAGRRAGLVLIFGGVQGATEGAGLQAAQDIATLLLSRLGAQGFVFYGGTVYRAFFATDKPAGTVELDVYVFRGST